MKKKISYIVLLLCCIVGAIYIYRYKLPNTIKNSFPKDTKAIVSVNLRKMEEHFLYDVLSNPKLYFSAKKDSQKKDSIKKDTIKPTTIFSLLKNTYIPKNIQFYTRDTDYNTWYSTVIAIKNQTILKKFLLEKGFAINETQNPYTLFDKENSTIISYKNKVIISISRKNTLIKAKELFTNEHFIDSTSALLKKLSEKKSDINIVTAKNEFLNLDFLKGKIKLEGYYNFDFLDGIQNKFYPLSNFGLNFNLNKENESVKKYFSQVNKQKFKKLVQLDLDSVYNAWNGSLQFNIEKFKTTIDTIITYDYDADFNRIEKKAIQKNINPIFNLDFYTDTNLLDYLKQQNTVINSDGKSIFKQFPLIETQVKSNDSILSFFTTSNLQQKSIDTHSKLYANISFYSYTKQTKGSIYEIHNFEKFDYGNLVISKNNNITSSIYLQNKSRYALAQLVK